MSSALPERVIVLSRCDQITARDLAQKSSLALHLHPLSGSNCLSVLAVLPTRHARQKYVMHWKDRLRQSPERWPDVFKSAQLDSPAEAMMRYMSGKPKEVAMQACGTLQPRRNSLNADWFASDISKGLTKRDSGELAGAILPIFYPKGGVLFLEGQQATGIFFLRTGRAKESIVSSTGKTAIVRIFGSGVILGLPSVLTGAPHESTVETLEPTQADFVWKVPFLHFLQNSPQLGQIVASQLSRDCKEAYASIRLLGASESVAERLARLLLHWAECPLPDQDRNMAGVRIRVTLTHEEIGQFVGSTRETTSRALGEFRKKKWITVKGSVWTITDERAIRHLAAL